MSIAKVTMNIDFLHSDAQLEKLYKHNYRHDGYYGANVDTEKSYMNEQLIGSPEESYKDLFYKKIEENAYYENHPIHKRAIRAYSFYMTLGEGEIPENFSYDKWKEKCMEFLKDEFSEGNVVSAILHKDEGKPHIHAIVVPMKEKLSSKQYIRTSYALSELHQKFYKGYMKELGLAPADRGTYARHEDIKKLLYTPLDKVAQENLSKPLGNESLDEYYERANNEFRDHNFADLKKEQKLKLTLIENEQLRKANHREEQEIRKTIEKEILKDVKAKTLDEVLEFAKAHKELKRGLQVIASSDPEKAVEINNGIKEAISLAQEAEFKREMEDALMKENGEKVYDDDEVKRYEDLEYADMELSV